MLWPSGIGPKDRDTELLVNRDIRGATGRHLERRLLEQQAREIGCNLFSLQYCFVRLQSRGLVNLKRGTGHSQQPWVEKDVVASSDSDDFIKITFQMSTVPW